MTDWRERGRQRRERSLNQRDQSPSREREDPWLSSAGGGPVFFNDDDQD
jgi:hypothetical protein